MDFGFFQVKTAYSTQPNLTALEATRQTARTRPRGLEDHFKGMKGGSGFRLLVRAAWVSRVLLQVLGSHEVVSPTREDVDLFKRAASMSPCCLVRPGHGTCRSPNG